tara:strand:+ start:254 stop:1066 length:813 start_codon:yes stop_codon:yes gene_type:complete
MPQLKCGDYFIDYEDAGDGSPVILIPSSASGNKQWRKLVGGLADQYRMISINMFGYGQTSSWPAHRQQTLEDQADLVVCIADMFKEPVRLVGHSFGASVAMKAAIKLKDRAKRLVAIEPNLFYLLKKFGREEAWQNISFLGKFVRDFGGQGEWTKVAAHFVDYWNEHGAWDSLTDQHRANLTEMVKPNLYEWDAVLECEDDISEFQSLVARMLVLKGAKTRKEISEIVDILFNELTGLETYEVPGCGHMLPISHPQMVNPIIEEYLGRMD